MSLNPGQTEAVTHGDGPLLVLAGAGSGKTRVLVHRIARLIGECGIPPWRILAVTFTNKAARELTERCQQLVGPEAADLWVGTFHGISARLLRRHAEAIGYTQRFTIYDTDDQMRILKELVAERNLSDTLFRPDAIRSAIDGAKNEALSPQAMARRSTDPFIEKSAEIYTAYQGRLKAANAMDFGDLITNMLVLFDEHPDILAHYQEKFGHVLVDEYQDTNHAQYLIVSRLAASHGNLCVVGDDDQSIYGWRGANIRNILEFDHDFPSANVVCLNINYRSTANIIEAAHAVISNNEGRREKHMRTDNAAGEKVQVYTASDERDEARYIIDGVHAVSNDESVVIFYRTHAQSRAVEEALLRHGIRYAVVGGLKFYDRKEIRDLIAYLRFVNNPDDDQALARIINVPARQVGKTTWGKLNAEARSRGCSVWKVICSDESVAGVAGAPRTRIAKFSTLAQPWFEMRDGNVADAVQKITEDTAYVDYLQALPGGNGDARVENVRELVTAAQNFDADYDAREFSDEDPDLGALGTFLEQVALQADVDQYDGNARVVTLMTLHNSKGLEFDHVFIAGMEEGLFPHSRSIDDAGIEEERRLAYVGMTRARKTLSLLRARRRHLYGTTQRNLASRFLDELPDELTEREFAPVEPGGSGGPFLNKSYGSFDAAKPEPVKSYSAGTYEVGMRVAHPLFGVGTVRRSDGTGDAEKLVVQFTRVGFKKLVARYAKLEIV